MKKIAIIGFGGAGYSAAREIRRWDSTAVIDVYSDTDTCPSNPMLTTYYVKGSILYKGMFPFGELGEISRQLHLNVYLQTPVRGVVPDEKTVMLSDGTKRNYDEILISTGASAVMPPIAGIDLPGVFKMRTVQDAVKLKEMLDGGHIRNCLVIGASWVGIKVVEDLNERGIPCNLVDGAPWMFYTAAFEKTAVRVQEDLEKRGISVTCGQMLSSIERNPEGGLKAVMKNGSSFDADAIAVCVGVRTNTAFLRDSGLTINRGIVVDSRMRTNYEGIYAAGDCCEAVDIQSGTNRNIGVWFNAVKQGRIAGANMAGVSMEFDANVLVNLAHYLDYDFFSVGDISTCSPEEQVYEYEDERYYIRGVKNNGAIRCINVIHSSESNGLLKNIFIKAIKNPEAALDIHSICYLERKGFPEDFIEFLGGISH